MVQNNMGESEGEEDDEEESWDVESLVMLDSYSK